jgi:hypothetical protein
MSVLAEKGLTWRTGTGRYAGEVLLTEDDQGDVAMITEAFEQSGARPPAGSGDGEQAPQFLHRAGGFTDAIRPIARRFPELIELPRPS